MNRKVFERFVREAVEDIPEPLKEALDNVALVIEDYPLPHVLDELGDEPLFGLYEGVPLPERELGMVTMPDKITIYRGEILDAGFRGRELVEEIQITVVHEIGHYFGLSDEEMEAMGY